MWTQGVGLIVAAAVLGGSPAPARSAEEDLVEEMYGERVKAVQATPRESDDLLLVGEILTAAGDQKNSPRLRYLLAQRALNMAMAIGTDAASAEARKALAIADGAQPMDAVEKAATERDIALNQLQRARKDRKSISEIRSLAQAAAEAQIQYAQTLLDGESEKFSEAEDALDKAAQSIAAYSLRELKDALTAATDRAKGLRARRRRLGAAEAKLDQARAAGDRAGIRSASEELANLYLELDGDLSAAAGYLKDSADDARATAILLAAKFQETGEIASPAKCPDALEALTRVAEQYKDQAARRIASCAVELAEAYLGTPPGAAQESRTRLLLARLKLLAGESEADLLRRRLDATYGKVRCKLTTLPGGRLRAAYYFSDDLQLTDWQADRGAWQIGGGVLACRTDEHDSGTITNKLKFSLAKPFRASFQAKADYELAAILTGQQTLGEPTTSPPPAGVSSFDHRYYLNKSGATHRGSGSSWREPRWQLRPSSPCKFELDYDGRGMVTWRIDGSEVRRHSLAEGETKPLGYVQLKLYTRRSSSIPTTFDDVILEGEIVLDK